MPAKQSLRNNNRKLTDFFGQGSSASVPARATTSTMRRKQKTRISRAAVDRDSPVNSSVPSQIRNVSEMTTGKRTRSPDTNNYSAPPFPPPKLRSSRKPAKISHSDSLYVRQSDVVDVTAPLTFDNPEARAAMPMQSHNDTLIASPSRSGKEIVYSSQSDEAELVIPHPAPRDLEEVVNGVHKWRRKAFESLQSTVQRVCADSMDADPMPYSPIHDSPTAGARSTSFPSPSTSEFPPLPSTPEPIDSEAKTARIIAEIKARAFATNQSSDDEQLLSFRELEDSDDGDIIGDLPLIGSARKKRCLFPARNTANGVFSSPLSSVPSTFDDTAAGPLLRKKHHSPLSRTTRTSTRIHKPSLACRPPNTAAEPSCSVGIAKAVSSSSNRKKPQAINPLQALLREKESEEKRGANLRLAEEAMRQASRETSVDSDNELDSISRLRLADEQAAWKAVHESRESTGSDGSNDAEDLTIGDRESKMLGTAAGEAIDKILAGNKNSRVGRKAQSMSQEVTPDVVLWTPSSDEDMMVDSISVPPLWGHPNMTRLDDLLRDDDNDPLVELILRAGILTDVPRDVVLSNTPQLLTIGIIMSSLVFDAVYIAFRDLWGSSPEKVQMPIRAILFALAQLGANHSVFEGLGLNTETAKKNYFNHETLLEAIQRFLAIVKAAGLASAFSPGDIPNIVLILAIMGLDPMTSGELRTQLDVTMDVVCNHCAMNDLLPDIHEKIVSFAGQLVPSNKALLVSFFASGSGRTRRIAQHLAYSLLVPACVVPKDQAPALEPLILLLSADAGSYERFDVTNELMNYEELGHYVYILSVALVDIVPYVEEERALMKSTSTALAPVSPKGSNKLPVPPLEHLRKVLEMLQSKISDTRATRLDRSRTKAAIQRLTMRIYYERMALTGIRPSQRLSTLKAYFSPQRQ